MTLLSAEELHSLDRQPRVRRVSRETITVVVTVEGAWEQSQQGDIVREVTSYFLDDGTLIARLDEYPEART